MSKHHPFQGIGLDKRQQRGYAKKLARCDRCGQFVDADALIVSEFIPPPREGMDDYIYCAACVHTLAPAGGCEPATPPRERTTTPAGATNEKEQT